MKEMNGRSFSRSFPDDYDITVFYGLYCVSRMAFQQDVIGLLGGAHSKGDGPAFPFDSRVMMASVGNAPARNIIYTSPGTATVWARIQVVLTPTSNSVAVTKQMTWLIAHEANADLMACALGGSPGLDPDTGTGTLMFCGATNHSSNAAADFCASHSETYVFGPLDLILNDRIVFCSDGQNGASLYSVSVAMDLYSCATEASPPVDIRGIAALQNPLWISNTNTADHGPPMHDQRQTRSEIVAHLMGRLNACTTKAEFDELIEVIDGIVVCFEQDKIGLLGGAHSKGDGPGRPDLIERMLRARLLTPAGAAWLKISTDPGHDFTVKPLEGRPDAENGFSVVQKFESQISVSAPGATAWDALIWNNPWSAGYEGLDEWIQMAECTQTGGVITWASNAAPAVTMHPVQVHVAATGEDLFPKDDAWAPTDFAQTGCNCMPTDLLGQRGRIIAQGIHLHDSSASINQQGMIVCGQVSQTMDFSDYCIHETVGDLVHQARFVSLSSPPATYNEAITHPMSVKWETEKGVYCAISAMQNDVPPTIAMPQMILFRDTSMGETNNAVGGLCSSGVLNLNTAQNQSAFGAAHSVQLQHTNMKYIFVSGMHPDGRLDLTVTTYLEYFPRTFEQLMYFATPSAGLDTLALRLYEEIFSRMPIAVPVGDNNAGEFFRKIGHVLLSAGKALLPLIGAALAPVIGPEAAVAGGALGALAGVGAAATRKKKKQQNQAPPRRPRAGARIVRRKNLQGRGARR